MTLELPVDSCLEDVDRASISIERRVSEKLIVERQLNGLGNGKGVIRFQRHLGGVAQVAVAVKNPRAARFKEGLLLGRSSSQVPDQTEGVAWAAPCGTFDAQTQLRRPVNIGVRRRCDMAVLPAKPTEEADILRDFLFPIHSNTVFEAEGKGIRGDGCFRSLRSIERRRGGEQEWSRRAVAGKIAM